MSCCCLKKKLCDNFSINIGTDNFFVVIMNAGHGFIDIINTV